MKNLDIFPTDFSDNAQNALSFALKIAKRTGATVHILHAIEEPYDFAPIAEEIKEGVTSKVRRLFDKIIRKIEQEGIYSDIPVETHIETGRAINAILEPNQSFEANLIVMGTRGRSGLKKILFGSTTAEVVQQSAIPVLVIPENVPITDFNQILFATDYHDGDLKALHYVGLPSWFYLVKRKVQNRCYHI